MDSQILRYSAFANAPHGGNPAGVILDASELSEQQMQRMAEQIGYPESAFVVGNPAERRYMVRYFSPAAEVPFCGHATVALAVAIAERTGVGAFTFETSIGDVELIAAEHDGGIQVSFTSVQTAQRELQGPARERLFALLGLFESDLAQGYPAQESYAGNWHPNVVLRDREIFHQFTFDPAPLATLMRENGWSGTVTVLLPLGENQFEARNLFPVGRINEDPATGSAAAATGAYLRAIGKNHGGDRVLIHQGARVARPSLLVVDIPMEGGPQAGITVTGGATAFEVP